MYSFHATCLILLIKLFPVDKDFFYADKKFKSSKQKYVNKKNLKRLGFITKFNFDFEHIYFVLRKNLLYYYGVVF